MFSSRRVPYLPEGTTRRTDGGFNEEHDDGQRLKNQDKTT